MFIFDFLSQQSAKSILSYVLKLNIYATKLLLSLIQMIGSAWRAVRQKEMNNEREEE